MKTTRLTVALSLITLVITHAIIASPIMEQPIGVQAPGETQPQPLPPVQTDSKDEDSALERAIAGSLIGPAMIVLAFNMPQGQLSNLAPLIGVTGAVAVVLGPSAGDWYTGRSSFAPTFARSVGVAMMIGSAAYAYGTGWCDDNGCQTSRSMVITTLAAGGALVIGGTIYDIVTARSGARDYNRAHASTLQWTPMLSRTTNGTTTGVALSGSF